MAAEGLLCAVGRWGLRDVSSTWVDTIWELDFTETEPLDPRQESVITEDGLDAFTQLYKGLCPFADEHGTTESIWTLFAENNISHKALVAVLYHFVQDAQSKKASVPQRLHALHAAGLYFLLVEIPGSVANQMFHSVMFEKCLQTLCKCWPQASDLPRKRKKGSSQSSQGDRNKKRGRSTRKENTLMDEMFEEEEEQEEELYLSAHELLQIREALFLLLKNLLRLLSKFSLKEKSHCLQTCIQIFVGLTSFEPCTFEFHPSERMTPNQARYVPELAYFGLRLLCSPLHSIEDKALLRVFHQLLSVILMSPRREGSSAVSATLPSQVVAARNQAIKFISSLTEDLKEAAFPVLRILLQHICVKVPDKSEYRTYAALALAQLLPRLPSVEHADFIAWLYRFSRNNKVSYRVFAIDAAMALLDLPERVPDPPLSEEQQAFLKHKFLVQVMVFGRCSDKVPTVRSKALSSLAQCLETKAPSSVESLQELLQGPAASTVMGTDTAAGTFLTNTEGSSSHRLKTFPTFKTIEVTSEHDTIEFDGKEIMAMLRLRAGDEKTNVRKSALQVLMSILKHNVIPCTPEDLAMLQDRCRDPAVSVRKQALQSITDLLMSQPSSVLIQKAWLTGVVPVVMDCENSVQEKALECLDQLLLQPVKHAEKFAPHNRSQVLAWDLLTLFTKESQELRRYLSKAFHIWSKRDKFSTTFVNSVVSHTETDRAAPAWMLLAKVAGSSPRLDYSKIIDAWDSTSRSHASSLETTVHILNVIGSIAKHLPQSVQDWLTDDIKCWLQDFRCPLEAISPAIETLQKLCHASAGDPKEAQELLDRICGDLVSACEHCISNIVLQENGTEQLDEDALVRHLFTLGEAAQLCPAKVEKRIFLLIQSILASPVDMEPMPSPTDSEDLVPSQPLSQFRGSMMPSVVRAHAFITLGKLCLQHEDLAKKCIAALARELEVSKDVAIRNNVVIVMCDLCIRYTTMADRYIPDVSTCLKDSEPFIRKQTLILLTNLLQEEFVKWKGSLFFRFVSTLVDPNQDIASLAEFCLVHLLLKRNPVMFSQHFIECIFHFNSYEGHEKYNRFPQSKRERTLFSLKGKAHKEKRTHIYKFLLEHMTDEQRFNITSKISLNVLACFVDGLLPLDMEASELLSDTFEILSCKEIKLSAMRSRPEEDIQPDEGELAMANVVMQVAQKKLISQVQKKNFIENVIPIITSLKTLLEQSRLPALRDLMNYLREVMQDYRNEIQEFFAADKQLAAELEYDMKTYEEQLERESGQGQEPPVEPEALGAAVQKSPSSERAALPGDQDKEDSPAARRDSLPVRLPPLPLVPVGFATPRVNLPKPRPRHVSLNTLAILNSAKKAVEATNKQRSRSVGERPVSPGSRPGSKQASFCSLNQQSLGANIALEGRAISTPEKSIDNVTFGAGVSYIGLIHTPASAQDKMGGQDPQRAVVCLTAPDKPSSQPPRWKISSPGLKNSGSNMGLRRSSRKPPLKPTN
ncbi:condensin-2 complex subunit D3 isoform X2 [Hemicordylus capensis]|uniref:condensin-2 complex subunit D3 isoform X2 n=1 Tax=Hemicordylus capensis TaxID=884348 RepID=UPI002302DDC6|nr:condensin-2 complex subunit D3 isoform X2 [Hemicordylus capensis]